MYIKCEHPNIILHPYAVERILQYGNYTIRGEAHYLTNEMLCRYYNYFPRKIIHPKALNITSEEIDDCYICDDTGIMHPMYLYVPCGKCILCKSKKVQDWQCRALCESETSTTKPLWIGLSYNDRWLPENGVVKADAQKFLKRLRIRLDRAGYDHELRYFLCSEYGDNDGRAHYHLLLFNFPDMDDQKKYLLIRDAWSRVVSLDEWLTFPDYSRFAHWKLKSEYDRPEIRTKLKNFYNQGMYKEMVPFCRSIRFHVRIGFIYFDVLDGRDGIFRVKYCMKYMYKDSKLPVETIKKCSYFAPRRKFIDETHCVFLAGVTDPKSGDYYVLPFHSKYRYGTAYHFRIAHHRPKSYKVRFVRKKYNKLFYLSSRKLAIGREWFDKNRKVFDNNVSLSTVKFKSFGVIQEYPIPVYYKNILYPSISRLVPKEVRDRVKEFNQFLFDRYKISYSQTNKTVPFYRDELDIIKKFKCLFWFTNFTVYPKFRSLNVVESQYRCANISSKKYDELLNYLKSVNIDSDYVINMQMRKELYTQNLIDFIRLQTEIPIADLVNKRKKIRLREIQRKKYLFKSENVY